VKARRHSIKIDLGTLPEPVRDYVLAVANEYDLAASKSGSLANLRSVASITPTEGAGAKPAMAA